MPPAYLPYAVSEMFLLALTIDILIRVDASLGSKAETRELKHVIYAFIAVLFTDILWAIAEDDSIDLSVQTLTVVNCLYLLAFSGLCFYWFRFTSVRLELKLDFVVPHKMVAIPFMANLVIVFISMFTDWIFYVSADGDYSHGKLYYVYLAINYLYVGIAVLRSLIALSQAKTTVKRRECMVCAAYLIPPLIGQQLKPIVPRVPVLHSCLYLILQILFLTLQENQIYNDALTGLNNRRRLNTYLEEQLPTASEKKPITVFMMDMNSFKLINDTYGHLEGDKALIIMGRALKRAAGEFNCFVARYGGDEFCLVSIGKEGCQQEIMTRIQELLTEGQRKAADTLTPGYTLTVSIGYATVNQPQKDMDVVIRTADERLHEEKQKFKRTHWIL